MKLPKYVMSRTKDIKNQNTVNIGAKMNHSPNAQAETPQP